MNKTNWRTCSAEQITDIKLPVLISPAFKKLIEKTEYYKTPENAKAALALRRQVEFSEAEKQASAYETADPLGEQKYCVTPYLVHQYENRVLLLVTGKCLSYCRYCFRRGFTARNKSCITKKELDKVCSYILQNSKITEILVSGGDPLTCEFEELKNILTSLRNIRKDLIIRLCTRAPIFAPELFTNSLIEILQKCRPIWLIPHINHPAELAEDQTAALLNCIKAGIPIQSQTVLLRGINDEPDILVKLFHTLACIGIKPGYLFQLDAAPGTSQFRVSLNKALNLWKNIENKLSGLSRPQFAVDLPDGGGKFPLSAITSYEKVVEKLPNGLFSAIGVDGVIHKYTCDVV